MQYTIDEHFVSEFYIKFWQKSKGKLWALDLKLCSDLLKKGIDISKKGIKEYSAGECCSIDDFYEFGKINDEYVLHNFVENKYGLLETDMGKFFKRIFSLLDDSRNNNSLIFNTKDKACLRKFVVSLYQRNPAFNSVDFEKEIKENELEGFSNVMKQIFGKDGEILFDNILHHIFIMHDAEKILKEGHENIGGVLYRLFYNDLNEKSMYILKADTFFVTSSNPVIWKSDFVYFPLSPKYAIVFCNKKDNILGFKANKINEIKDCEVLNELYLNYKGVDYIYSVDKNTLENLKSKFMDR